MKPFFDIGPFSVGLYGVMIALGVIATLVVAVALAAIAGHNWSPYLKGKGGRGVASSLGVVLVLFPLAALLSLVISLPLIWIPSSSGINMPISLVCLVSSPPSTGKVPTFFG